MKKFNNLSILFLSVVLTVSVNAEMDKKSKEHKSHQEKSRKISSTDSKEKEIKDKTNKDEFRMNVDRFGRLPLHY